MLTLKVNIALYIFIHTLFNQLFCTFLALRCSHMKMDADACNVGISHNRTAWPPSSIQQCDDTSLLSFRESGRTDERGRESIHASSLCVAHSRHLADWNIPRVQRIAWSLRSFAAMGIVSALSHPPAPPPVSNRRTNRSSGGVDASGVVPRAIAAAAAACGVVPILSSIIEHDTPTPFPPPRSKRRRTNTHRGEMSKIPPVSHTRDS
jgi:hypothetical protein